MECRITAREVTNNDLRQVDDDAANEYNLSASTLVKCIFVADHVSGPPEMLGENGFVPQSHSERKFLQLNQKQTERRGSSDSGRRCAFYVLDRLLVGRKVYSSDVFRNQRMRGWLADEDEMRADVAPPRWRENRSSPR